MKKSYLLCLGDARNECGNQARKNSNYCQDCWNEILRRSSIDVPHTRNISGFTCGVVGAVTFLLGFFFALALIK